MEALAGAILGFTASMIGGITLLAACPYAQFGLWVPLMRLSVLACTAAGAVFAVCASALAGLARTPAAVPQPETVP